MWFADHTSQSFVSTDLYEFYTYNFYMEQISVDEDDIETRLRFHRSMRTPLLKRPVFIENRESETLLTLQSYFFNGMF